MLLHGLLKITHYTTDICMAMSYCKAMILPGYCKIPLHIFQTAADNILAAHMQIEWSSQTLYEFSRLSKNIIVYLATSYKDFQHSRKFCK